MQITLTLLKSVIVEAVKADTYLHGETIKAANPDGSTASLAYHTTAGDDDVDSRKIDRDVRYSVERLKTVFVDYLTPTAAVKGVDLIDSSITDDKIIFRLTVSTRWNGTLTDACARLSSRYIQDCATMMWYLAIGDKQAEYYSSLLKQDELEVRKCFIKSPPTPPTLHYPTNISFQTTNMKDGVVTLIEGDDDSITYTLNDGAIDDIETRSSEPSIVRTFLDNESKWCVAGLRPGVATITFFSRHNDTVRASCDVVVKEDPDKRKDQHIDPYAPFFPHQPYR